MAQPSHCHPLGNIQMVVQIFKKRCYCRSTHLMQIASALLSVWMGKNCGNLDRVPFGGVYNFSVQLSSSRTGAVHPNEKNRLWPSSLCAVVWIILQTCIFAGIVGDPASHGLISITVICCILSPSPTWCPLLRGLHAGLFLKQR